MLQFVPDMTGLAERDSPSERHPYSRMAPIHRKQPTIQEHGHA